MTGPVTRFFRMEGGQRRLLLEAFRELSRSRRALARKPVRELLTGSEGQPGESSAPDELVGNSELAKQIGWAVRAASAYTPWSSSCLVQVIAAQKMLRERGIGGVIYLGTARGDAAGFKAHAWLKHGETFITGEAGHEQYQVLTTFSW